MVSGVQHRFGVIEMLRSNEVIVPFDNVLCFMLAGAVTVSQLNTSIAYLSLKAAAVMLLIRFFLKPVQFGKVKWIFASILAFECFRIVSSLFSSDPLQSFTVFKIRLVYYTVFFGIVFVVSEERILISIIRLFIYSVALISVVEISMFVFDIITRHLNPSEFRIGYFSHPITTAQVKMMVILLIFTLLLLGSRPLISRKVLTFLAIPVLLSFLFTNSRWAFIVMFAALAGMGIVFNRRLAMAVVIFLIFYLAVLPGSINGRIITAADPENPSTAARVYMFSTGLEIAYDNPVTGTGNIDLSDVYQKYKHIDITGEGRQLHNNFIQLLSTNGIPGLLLWLTMMILLIGAELSIIKNALPGSLKFTLGISSMLTTISFFACGWADWNFADPGCVLIFWFLASLAFAADRIQAKLLQES